MSVSSDCVEAVGVDGIEVIYPEGLEAARWLQRAILLAVEQRDMASAFCLYTKLQGFVLRFLLSSSISADFSFQCEEYLSILSALDKAISKAIS